MAEDQKRTAAYVPWATFKNSLDQLAKGVPTRIDRSVFQGIAWNAQTQLFIALRFFGLLKGEDEPTPLLEDLIQGSEEERKGKLAKVIRDGYAELIAMGLTKASRSHFEEKMSELYNVSGDTKVKAVRFFISAAEYVGISLSSFILPEKGKAGGSRRPRQISPRVRTPKPATPAPSDPTFAPHAKPNGTSKTVSLASGGTLTLSATLDLFSLGSKDREFLFELIDRMEDYAKA